VRFIGKSPVERANQYHTSYTKTPVYARGNAWLICHWRAYNAAAWAFTISAFCLGLLVGAENATNGKFKVPFLSGQHHRHLIHHAASR
jgi:hypothetical protein